MERLAQWVTVALFGLVLVSVAGSILAPVWPSVHPAWTVALVGAVLFGLHRALVFAEDRGWIYYRKRRGSYGGLGVTSEFLNMYDPSRKHMQQTVRMSEWKRDEDDDGDDPDR
jgi:hypothetical protein